jgi:uncharacterized protein
MEKKKGSIVEVIASLYEAFGRADIAFILAHFADHCEWKAAGSGSLPFGGSYIGKDVGTFFLLLAQFEEINQFQVFSIHSIKDHEAVAFGHIAAVIKTSGKLAESDWVMHWKFNEEGKTISFQDYFDAAFDAAAVYKVL